jgi:hypothetical protein
MNKPQGEPFLPIPPIRRIPPQPATAAWRLSGGWAEIQFRHSAVYLGARNRFGGIEIAVQPGQSEQPVPPWPNRTRQSNEVTT